MGYSLDVCSTYKHIAISGKDIYVFDEHNMALPVWGTFSSRRKTTLELISFDTHTDTRNPFARFMGRMSKTTNREYMHNPIIKQHLMNYHYLQNDFSFEDVWRLSICDVAHDEQIQTAVDWGYLSSYTVVCNISREHALDYQRQDECDKLPGRYVSTCDWFSVAEEVSVQYKDAQLALDFDLDFFRCAGDMNQEFWKSIKSLVKQSQVITVARENDCFNSVSLDPQFTNDIALESLIRGIRNILTTDD